MAKNSFQDIVKPKNSNNKILINKKENIDLERFSNSRKILDDSYQEKPKHTLWFVAIIAVVFLIFSISILFSSASVTVNPKQKDFTLDSSFTANKEVSADGLNYDLVVLSGEENKSIPTTGEKDSLVKATGTITLFNSFSSKPQILAINSRLEGSNGKIYLVNNKVSVPGILKDGKPGFIEVGITATDAGEDYNNNQLDFKVLGFKGSDKYNKIFGLSKNAISGGFKGQVPIINEEDKTTALKDLQSSLQEKLLKKASDQIPEGFILYKDAVFLEVPSELSLPTIKDSQAIFSLKGTLYGFIFNEKNLTKSLVNNLIPQFDGSDVFIPNIKDMVFSLSTKDSSSFADTKSITFNLNGKPKIVWKVDTDKLTADLINVNKKDFNNVLSGYSNITSADLVLRPAWKSSFPDKTKNIKIIVNYPQE